MAKKLTPTELKVLALEAQNRILAAVDAKNEATKNRPDYKSFDDDFDSTVVGSTFVQFIDVAKELDEAMKKEGYEPDRYRKELTENAIQTRDCFRNQLKSKAFPLINAESISPETASQWGGKMRVNLYDHFLHQLSLKQLTSETGIESFLEELVQEYLKKI